MRSTAQKIESAREIEMIQRRKLFSGARGLNDKMTHKSWRDTTQERLASKIVAIATSSNRDQNRQVANARLLGLMVPMIPVACFCNFRDSLFNSVVMAKVAV